MLSARQTQTFCCVLKVFFGKTHLASFMFFLANIKNKLMVIARSTLFGYNNILYKLIKTR